MFVSISCVYLPNTFISRIPPRLLKVIRLVVPQSMLTTEIFYSRILR